NVEAIISSMSESALQDSGAARVAAKKMDAVLDNLDKAQDLTKEEKEDIKERIANIKEKVVDSHIKVMEEVSKKKPEEAAKAFSKTLNRMEKRVKKETQNPNENIEQADIENYQKYADFGKRISEMAKGIRTGTTTVKDLVDKATSHHERVLKEVRDKVRQKTGAPADVSPGTRSQEEQRSGEGPAGSPTDEIPFEGSEIEEGGSPGEGAGSQGEAGPPETGTGGADAPTSSAENDEQENPGPPEDTSAGGSQI
ncbi:MAG TPA: hypothetical protein VKO42_04385, partial [Patescibacteria group bacterium]|nr:hypothetical protein [Patescibacteria group bacterium]